MLDPKKLMRYRATVWATLTALSLNCLIGGSAAADLVAPERETSPSGFSIESRLGAEPEWETTPSQSAAPSNVWDAAMNWAQEQLTLSNDTYFNSRTFSSTYDDLWWLKSIQAPEAWGLSAGSGVTVAVVDTGIDYNHEDLSGNVWTNAGEIAGNGLDDDGNGFVDDWRGWDFANGDNDALDDNGHGTHVAGIIGALKDNGKGIAGVAPNAKIMGVKVLDKSGSGTFDNIVKGIKYAADRGARVINLSLGAVFNYSLDYIKTYYASYFEAILKPMQDVIAYATGRGSLVVAASGNSGVDVNRTAPAGFTDTLSVGATTPTGGKAYFSNSGQTLDITAPGWDVLSLKAAGTNLGTAAGTGYTRLSGTSMATPMVSGVVALLLAQDPTLDIAGIERRLKFSAKDLGAAGFDTSFGYGQVDALNAITHDYYADGKVKTLWLLAPDAKGMVRYDYDAAGKVVSSIDAAGRKHTSEYDSKGNKIERYPSGRIKTMTDSSTGTVYEYFDEDLDGKGAQRVSRSTDKDGVRTDYTYWSGTTVVKTKKIYDKSGRLVRSETYDSYARLTTAVEGVLKTSWTYWGTTAQVRSVKKFENDQVARIETYDESGQLRSLTVVTGTRKVETIYSALGQVQQISVWENSLLSSVNRYYANGLKSYEAVYLNGVLVRSGSYDDQGRLRVLLVIEGSRKTETTYYASGKVRQVAESQNGQRTSITQYYESGVMSYLVLYQSGRVVSETFYNTDGTVRRTKTYAQPSAPAPVSSIKK